jgi:hypothetical protein
MADLEHREAAFTDACAAREQALDAREEALKQREAELAGRRRQLAAASAEMPVARCAASARPLPTAARGPGAARCRSSGRRSRSSFRRNAGRIGVRVGSRVRSRLGAAGMIRAQIAASGRGHAGCAPSLRWRQNRLRDASRAPASRGTIFSAGLTNRQRSSGPAGVLFPRSSWFNPVSCPGGAR